MVAVVSALSFFSVFGLYRAVIRFMGPKAMFTVIAGVTFRCWCWPVRPLLGEPPDPAVGIWHLLGAGAAVRRRQPLRGSLSVPAPRACAAGAVTRVAIYGAGDAGARLSPRCCSAAPDFEPVAFIDDKKSLQGSSINGMRVYGSDVLPELVRQHRIERVLLAMPAPPRDGAGARFSTQLEPLGVHVQSLPDLSDLISGKAQISELRDVDVSDLLGRDPVPPKPKLFGIVHPRQVRAGHRRRRLDRLGAVPADHSPGSQPAGAVRDVRARALHHRARARGNRRARAASRSEIVPLLGNAHHRHRVREVLSAFGVQTVYHAAAYKHVPIVEHNVVEGIHNNVISTWYTAEAALETGVETFVLISTDKAVNPANVMGATKRLAELVLQALQERTTQTRFCMVRFGNVLASSGSVVPLFQEQIRRGGPVTVTHPRCHPLLHDHSRGRAAGDPGGLDGQGRRCVRARHGPSRCASTIWRGAW